MMEACLHFFCCLSCVTILAGAWQSCGCMVRAQICIIFVFDICQQSILSAKMPLVSVYACLMKVKFLPGRVGGVFLSVHRCNYSTKQKLIYVPNLLQFVDSGPQLIWV